MVLDKKIGSVIVSPVIRVVGDFDKVGDSLLGNLRAAKATKSIPFFEEFGVTVKACEVNSPPDYAPDIRRYNIFKSSNGIIFLRDIPALGKAFVAFKDLNSHVPVLEWNSLFRWWSNLPVTKVGRIGHHLESIIALKLLERDMVLLHGSAISMKGSAILFTGLPNQGKTWTAIELIREGYEFLSEDICVLSASGEVFPVPFTTSLKDQKDQKKTLLDIFVDLRIPPVSNLNKVVILERAQENSISGLSLTEAAQRILLINHLEFNYHRNDLLRTYFAFHLLPPIHHLMALEEDIIRKAISRSFVYLVRFSDHSFRTKLVQQLVNRM
jgi:hypothetical protein